MPFRDYYFYIKNPHNKATNKGLFTDLFHFTQTKHTQLARPLNQKQKGVKKPIMTKKQMQQKIIFLEKQLKLLYNLVIVKKKEKNTEKFNTGREYKPPSD
ncbi:hypothetical protein [Candidatus Phytoplasma sp. AldY-WA1]|uniref:hypothetical protein n=1 Tax=Candidatus Phytoplasma sp. AldY-WA1 TaxID=2852100 RepID=UPI00254D8741|nr:hypothetical protein [Candidatus Phytoplasma sp. AldY-WA1]